MYKIGSFNCLNLGVSASNTKIIELANIILREKFDIIALQEIKGKLALNRILFCLGSGWRGSADNEVNDYAFIWNANKFELANAEEIGLTREYAPRIYKQYRVDRKAGQKDLVREPFYARFFPTGGAAPYIEIRLINTHIRFSKGKEGENDMSLSAIAMRRNEFDVLTRAIYAKEADKRYGNNRPAYTFLLGDYNLNLPTSVAKSPYLLESFIIEDRRNIKVITTVQRGLTTLARASEQKENVFSNNYDHFTYDVKRFDDVTIISNEVNVVEKYYKGDYEKYREDISDHIPVEMKMNLRG